MLESVLRLFGNAIAALLLSCRTIQLCGFSVKTKQAMKCNNSLLAKKIMTSKTWLDSSLRVGRNGTNTCLMPGELMYALTNLKSLFLSLTHKTACCLLSPTHLKSTLKKYLKDKNTSSKDSCPPEPPAHTPGRWSRVLPTQ